MSQLTKVSVKYVKTLLLIDAFQRVRLYGADCNQSALVVRINSKCCTLVNLTSITSLKPSGKQKLTCRSTWAITTFQMTTTPPTTGKRHKSRTLSRPTALIMFLE